MKIGIVLATLLISGVVYGQPPGLIRGEQVKVTDPGSTALPFSIVVLNPNGTLQVATLGPGLSLDRTTVPPTLRVTVASAPATEIVGEVLVAAKGEPYPLSRPAVPGSIRVFVNGVRQDPGSYTVATSTGAAPQTTITFIPYMADWLVHSVVIADYRPQ